MKCYNPRLAFKRAEGGRLQFTSLTWSQYIHHKKGYSIPPINQYIVNKGLTEALPIPCGSCEACHLERSQQTAIRCMHELQYPHNNIGIFLTLTYDDENLPKNGHLDYNHPKNFVKHLRDLISPHKISTLGCAEYGEKGGRPHYHLLIFGWEPKDKQLKYESQSGSKKYSVFESKTIDRIWKKGLAEFGSIERESANYVARYTLKKCKNKNKNKNESEKPKEKTICRSLRPALGKLWYEKYSRSVRSIDASILLDATGAAQQLPVPRYYDRLLEKESPNAYEALKTSRKEFQPLDQYENSKERKDQKKQVHRDKIKTLIRKL